MGRKVSKFVGRNSVSDLSDRGNKGERGTEAFSEVNKFKSQSQSLTGNMAILWDYIFKGCT